MRQKEVKAKEEFVNESAFIHLNTLHMKVLFLSTLYPGHILSVSWMQ